MTNYIELDEFIGLMVQSNVIGLANSLEVPLTAVHMNLTESIWVLY